MRSDSELLGYGLVLFAAGFGSGFAGGLFGIGGGLLRVPIFVYVLPAFGIPAHLVMHIAAGTSLCLAVPTGLRSALSQRASGHLDVPFLRSWIPPLVVGVLVGLAATRATPTHVLKSIFAVAMLCLAIEMLVVPRSYSMTERVPGRPVRDLIAVGIGAISSMIGLSGGAFTTPVLTLLGHPIHRTLAISSVGAAVVAGVGAIGFAINGLGVAGRPSGSVGYVDGVAVVVMLPAILLGAPLGVRLANRISENRLRRSFGVFLLVVAIDMLRQVVAMT